MTPSSRPPSLSFQMLDRFIEYCYLASVPAPPRRTEGTDGGPLSYSGVKVEAGVLCPLAELDRKVAVLMLLKLPPGSGQKGTQAPAPIPSPKTQGRQTLPQLEVPCHTSWSWLSLHSCWCTTCSKASARCFSEVVLWALAKTLWRPVWFTWGGKNSMPATWT